ncbi:putative HTH-type transcriptional regulator YcxD [Paenibacillus sp. J31TS4]|uniref:aminotransferase-like domain-containing protein n=1 Tax=Paenibacillus sp. J31TS4 TaxID=2807195 RepID=UPI001B1F0804|nr:PLP-dependent aminotransferase family protein [Paenibacillus sp. J31TS4]GIP40190.1 putative HTH-type transcriptional regulator YcxD [Paenibacillus sp. J31TS4]
MKYSEVMQYIEQRIGDGSFPAGSRLPSIRALAERFSCSNNTVIKAFSQLEKSHTVYSVAKSGYYVVEGPRPPRTPPAKGLGIDFLSAGPDPAAMPYRDYQHCINQAIDLYKEEMFAYSDPQGLLSLREGLVRYLRDSQVFTEPGRVCVTTGSQQALHLLVSLPFPSGKRHLCVEQPTHAAFVESVKQQGAVAYGIDVTPNGVDMDRLERLFREGDIKFFYTVSRFHNPTGYSYTNAEKRRIVELAQRYDVYIVEDDYLGDLDPNTKLDPMFAYDPSGRVIYTKSFSKVMLPGMRLGLAVIPSSIREAFVNAKFAADLHTPVLMQGALELYLKSGMFQAHIQRMRVIYTAKAIRLQAACRTHLPPSSAYSGSLSGFYAAIELPKPLKAARLIERLQARQVYVDDARRMYLPGHEKDSVIRLSLSQVEEELIEPGVRCIAEEIRALQKEQPVVRFR